MSSGKHKHRRKPAVTFPLRRTLAASSFLVAALVTAVIIIPSHAHKNLVAAEVQATTIHTGSTLSPSPLVWHHPKTQREPVAYVAVTFPYTYTVRKSDTLSSIARQAYNRSDAWTLIYYSNHLKSQNIYTGEKLKIVRLVGQPPRPPALPVTHKPTGPVSSPPPTSNPPPPTTSLQAYAQSLFGSQYSCADNIILHESGWNIYATNPYSGAYGIPQALPGSKMASAGADWETDGDTQLRWMLGYVDGTYGGACNAWAFWEGHGSY